MGWGHNPETVAARADLLEELAKDRPTVWTTDQDMAVTKRLAYNIREALHIAAQHPTKFPELAQAHDNYSIYVVGPGRVEARRKSTPSVRADRADLAPIMETPVHGIVTPLTGFKTVAQVGITTADECISSWNEHLPSSDPLLLQRTNLDFGELLKLHAWTRKHTPRMMILVGDEHITLSLYEAGVAAIAGWQPPMEPEVEEEFPDL